MSKAPGGVPAGVHAPLGLSELAPSGAAPADVQATVTVGGDISGQVAIGNNIVQMRIDTVHGNVVNVVSGDRAPKIQRRERPLRILPRKVGSFLDRIEPVDAAVAAMSAGGVIEFHGPAGVGKSTLLRHLAYHPAARAVPGGQVHLSARGLDVDDLMQSCFDVAYASDAPWKPSRGALRQHLGDVDPLLLIDDVGLSGDDAGEVLDTLPSASIVLCSEAQTLRDGPSVALHGLPPAEASALVEQALERKLSTEELAVLVGLSPEPVATPLFLRQIANVMRHGGLSLRQVLATPGHAPGDAVALTPQEDRPLLAMLAVVPGLALDAAQAAAVSDDPNAGARLEAAGALGLVQSTVAVQGGPARYTLAAGIPAVIRGSWDLTAAESRLRQHFRDWAERHEPGVAVPEQDLDAAKSWLRWAAEHGWHRDVLEVGAAVESAFARSGRWGGWNEVLQAMRASAREIDDPRAQSQALHQLGTRALCSGDTAAAEAQLNDALQRRKLLGDRAGAAVTSHNLDVLHALFSAGGASQPGRLREAMGKTSPAIKMLALAIVVLGAAVWLWPTGNGGDLVADTAALEFGEQPVGTRTLPRRVTVTNEGSAAVSAITVAIEGGQAGEFSVADDGCRTGVGPGASCRVEVWFNPTGTGARRAELRVAGGGEVTVTLTGTGIEAGGLLASPSTLEFGEQPVGTRSAGLPVTITNQGPDPLATVALEIQGEQATEFTVVDEGCGGGLDVGASCRAVVSFGPTVVGVRGALLVAVGDGEVIVAVAGTGGPPPLGSLRVDPALLDFGEQVTGSTGAERTVVVTNATASDVVVEDVVVRGDEADDFALTDTTCGGALASEEACAVTVRFAPRAEGRRRSSLVVVAAGDGVIAALSGTGLSPTGAPLRMPDVTGILLEQAEVTLGELGIEVDEITEAPSSDFPEGAVSLQDPDPDTVVTPDLLVRLVVSSGPELVAVPDVRRKTLQEAEQILAVTGLGLGRVTDAASSEVPAGLVVDQDPDPPELVPRGGAVDIVRSTGPAPTEVPTVDVSTPVEIE